jgi:hypothetical protein
MAIKKYRALSPDPYINKIVGDTEFARLAHLNDLANQVQSEIDAIVPTTYTPGSVLFTGPAGNISQDPTQLYWDDVNNRLGIGLNTPTSALHVIGGENIAAPLGTLPLDYNTGVLKLPQLTIEAVTRGNMSSRVLIRAGGWHTSSWFGAGAMQNWTNTGGSAATQNDAFGYIALAQCTSGNNNQAFGGWALGDLTTGSENCAFGLDSLWHTTTAIRNTAMGHSSGIDNLTGGYNTFIGNRTGRGITSGNYNTVLGAFVSGLASTLSNTVIIADGQGNRRLYVDNVGNAAFGTTTPAASAKLSVVSTTAGFLPPVMTGAQAEAIVSPAEGLMVYATAAGSGAITAKGWWGYNGSTWTQLG